MSNHLQGFSLPWEKRHPILALYTSTWEKETLQKCSPCQNCKPAITSLILTRNCISFHLCDTGISNDFNTLLAQCISRCNLQIWSEGWQQGGTTMKEKNALMVLQEISHKIQALRQYKWTGMTYLENDVIIQTCWRICFFPPEPRINRKSTRLSLWSAFFSCQGAHQRCKFWVETSQVVLDKVRELTTKLTTCNWKSIVMQFQALVVAASAERKRNFAFTIIEKTQKSQHLSYAFCPYHLLCPFFHGNLEESPRRPVGPPPTTTKLNSLFRSWRSVRSTAACAPLI